MSSVLAWGDTGSVWLQDTGQQCQGLAVPGAGWMLQGSAVAQLWLSCGSSCACTPALLCWAHSAAQALLSHCCFLSWLAVPLPRENELQLRCLPV